MRDSHNREINYLRVSVTDRCNLRCRYCMPKEGFSSFGHNDILRYEEILRIVRIAVRLGVVKVRVTGGEPLVRKGLTTFMETLGTIRGILDLSMTTNGILLANCAEDLRKAGVRRVNVSLDSLDAHKYRYVTRGGDIGAVLQGLHEASRVGFCPVKINVVTMRGFNDDEIVNFAALAADGPYEVRFIERMPVGLRDREAFGGIVPGDEVLARLRRRFTLEPVEEPAGKADGPAVRYRINGGSGFVGLISPLSHHFCRHCNRLRLTADGHLRGCLFSDGETPLKPSLREGCSDERLEALIRKTIAGKPLEHPIRAESSASASFDRPMHAIGG